MRNRPILAALVCGLSIAGCGDFFAEGPSSNQPKPTGPAQPGGPGSVVTNPPTNQPLAQVKTLAQLRDPEAQGYQAPCASDQGCQRYQVEKVVVTSEAFVSDRDKTTKKPYLFSFFVADPKAVDESGRLKPYSGIQVMVAPGAKNIRLQGYTFGRQEGSYAEPNKVNYEGFPRPGDVLVLEGESKSYFGMPQFTKVGKIEKVTTAADVVQPLPARFDAALEASDAHHPSALKGGHPAATVNGATISEVKAHKDAASWTGVLVELVGVESTSACVPTPFPFKNPTQLRDYGYFLVSGDVEIGTLFGSSVGGYWKTVKDAAQQTCENTQNKCEDSRAKGQHFDSISGIVDFGYGVYRVNPRSKKDIGPASVFVVPGTGSCRSDV